MKLYVWNNPYPVRWGGSCAYVIAESEEQARQMMSCAKVAHYGCAPRDEAVMPPEPIPAPDRVHDLPYAEIYEWEE